MRKDRHIDIMGIVNLTDDSFFSGSRCPDETFAIRQIERMIDQGASIIDLGACSTRPGSIPVGVEQEWRRLEPVLRILRDHFPDVRISIDTEWSEIVSRAYDLKGDFIVNDVSSGQTDEDMLPLVGNLGLTYVATHRRGTSSTMQSLAVYDDVVREVLSFFTDFAQKALVLGIDDWILDPGFGFSKTIAQNYQLLSRLDELKFPMRKMLVGVSRKSMIYKLFDITPEESLPSTQVLHYKALECGADILRVHDVAEAVRTVEIYRHIG